MSDREKLLHCYVVEGNTDRDRIKKLGAQLVIVTGGERISSDTLRLISLTSKIRDIVILTDPDSPGKRIAKRVAEICEPDSFTIVHTRFRDSIRGGKVGVAQMSTSELKKVIDPYLKRDKESQEKLKVTASDLMELKLIGAGSRANKERLSKKLGINFYSAKQLMICLNCLGIDIEEVEGAICESE